VRFFNLLQSGQTRGTPVHYDHCGSPMEKALFGLKLSVHLNALGAGAGECVLRRNAFRRWYGAQTPCDALIARAFWDRRRAPASRPRMYTVELSTG
jgi:hypothetical protein